MYEHLKISMNGPCDLDNMSPEEIRASLEELVSRMGQPQPEPEVGGEDETS